MLGVSLIVFIALSIEFTRFIAKHFGVKGMLVVSSLMILGLKLIAPSQADALAAMATCSGGVPWSSSCISERMNLLLADPIWWWSLAALVLTLALYLNRDYGIFRFRKTPKTNVPTG